MEGIFSYTYYAIKDGTPWSKTFAAGDWYKVEFYGVTTEGTVVGPVEQYLADYRADSDVNHYIIKDWTVVNLLPLNAKGSLKYIYLQKEYAYNYVHLFYLDFFLLSYLFLLNQ